MSLSIKALAAYEAKGELKPFTYEALPLGDDHVEIKITHCGVCHSDVHQIDNDWKGSMYPIVPGHEIVGTVTAVGKNVSHLKVGDRAGVGAQRGSCHSCGDCDDGDESLCDKGVYTYNGTDSDGSTTYGGFSTGIRCDAQFAVRIPDNLSSENAAPLLCAGVTVFTPLRFFRKDTDKAVAVLGVGGLGHLALQFAKAMGFETIAAVSTSPDKEEFARGFGANMFICSTIPQQMHANSRKFDLIISTISGNHDLTPYTWLLKKDGRLCTVGLPAEPVSLNLAGLIFSRGHICGSLIGSPHDLRDMIQMASQHNIQAKTELLPMSRANEAIERVKKNLPRFRVVLVNDLE